MRHIYLVLVLFTLTSFSEKEELAIEGNTFDYTINEFGYYNTATPEMFGYVHGGDADMNNAALQALFDTTQNVVMLNQTYSVNATLNVDTVFNQTIQGSGSTILQPSTFLQQVINVDFRGTANTSGTTLNNFTIDGNAQSSFLLIAYSKIHTDNIVTTNGLADGTGGIYVNIYNQQSSWGDWNIDNSSSVQMFANNNGTVAVDAIGVASGFLVYTREIITTPTRVIVDGGSVNGMWGEDSQAFGYFSPGHDNRNSQFELIVRNFEMRNVQRRLLKGFASRATYENVDFHFVDKNHPDYDLSVETNGFMIGLAVISERSGATGVGDILFKNCTFYGDNVNTGEEIDEVILQDVGDIAFEGCTWADGSDLEFASSIGQITVCGSNFGAGSVLDVHSNPTGTPPAIQFDTDNTYAEGSFFSGLAPFTYTELDLTCDVSQPTINVKTIFGFGLN